MRFIYGRCSTGDVVDHAVQTLRGSIPKKWKAPQNGLLRLWISFTKLYEPCLPGVALSCSHSNGTGLKIDLMKTDFLKKMMRSNDTPVATSHFYCKLTEPIKLAGSPYLSYLLGQGAAVNYSIYTDFEDHQQDVGYMRTPHRCNLIRHSTQIPNYQFLN